MSDNCAVGSFSVSLDMYGINEKQPNIHQSEVLDRLVSMNQQGRKYYIRDYLADIEPTSDAVNSWCRYKMVQWCYQITDQAEFKRETVSMAINYLDRYLSIHSPRIRDIINDRTKYQLCAMTCLFTAIKLNESKMIDTNLMAELSRGYYRKQDFVEMELEITAQLKWYLNGPTSLAFLEHYLVLLPLHRTDLRANHTTITEIARYQIELSVGEYSLITVPPSIVAVAALMNSVRSVICIHDRYTGDVTRALKVIQDISGVNIMCPSLVQVSSILHRLTAGSNYHTPKIYSSSDTYSSFSENHDTDETFKSSRNSLQVMLTSLNDGSSPSPSSCMNSTVYTK